MKINIVDPQQACTGGAGQGGQIALASCVTNVAITIIRNTNGTIAAIKDTIQMLPNDPKNHGLYKSQCYENHHQRYNDVE